MAFVIAGAALLCGPVDLGANPNHSEKGCPLSGADALFDYARYSFENQDYETAVIELKRFLHFYPNDHRAAKTSYHLGLSYFRMKKYDLAVNAFQKTAETYPDSEFAIESRFQISRSEFRMNNPDAAANRLIRLIEETDQPSVKDRAFFRLGWISLETGRIGQARTWFERVSPKGQTEFKLAELQKDMERVGELPYKHPFLAGIFSIIPGGGYLYTGRYQDAAVAFMVNAALMGAAYESFDNDLEVLGGVLALIETGFYAGSIYGGISSAHKFNRSAYNRFMEKLKETHQGVTLSALPANSGIEIAFTCRF